MSLLVSNEGSAKEKRYETSLHETLDYSGGNKSPVGSTYGGNHIFRAAKKQTNSHSGD
jgi:hypothetical protein